MANWPTLSGADVAAFAQQNLLQTLKQDIDGQIACTGVQQWDKGADVASANPLVLGNDGNYFDITGVTGFASITQLAVGGVAVQAGTGIKLHFDGALIITYHATNLVLPGGANITTVAGDEAEFMNYDGAQHWRCTKYQRGSGVPWIDVRDYASFSAAIDTIGADEKTLLIPNEQAVAVDKTVPINITLKFLQGGSLNVANTKTVTINGHIEAGLHRIFKWTGTGRIIFGGGSVSEVWADWWGITPDAIRLAASATGTDSQPGFQAAFNAAQTSGIKIVRYSHGNYYFANPLILCGAGAENAIRLQGSAMAHQINSFSGYITGAAGITQLIDIGGGSDDAISTEIDGVFLLGYTGGPITGIEFTSTFGGPARPNKIINCYIAYFTNGIASSVTLASGVLSIRDNVIIANAYGIKGTVASAFLITEIVHNIIEQNTSGGIYGYFSGPLTITDNLLEGQPNAIYISTGLLNAVIEHNYFELNTDYLIFISATNPASTVKIASNYYVDCTGKFIKIYATSLDLKDKLSSFGVKLYPTLCVYNSHIEEAMYPELSTDALAVSLDVNSIIKNSLTPLSPTNGSSFSTVSAVLVNTPLGPKHYESVTTNSSLFNIAGFGVLIDEYVAVTGFVRRPVGSTATNLVFLVYNSVGVLKGTGSFGGLFFRQFGKWEPFFFAIPISEALVGSFQIRFQTDAGGTFDVTDFYVYTQPYTSAFYPYLPPTGFLADITPLTVALGGTGLATVAAGSYLKGNVVAALVPRTVSEVRTDLGLGIADSPTLKALTLSDGQLVFPAVQVPSADANTLDDYEEGTWVMGISFGGAAVDITYSLTAGLYTKIGNVVTVSGLLALTSKGSSVGNARITGLPFTALNNTGAYVAVALRFNKITFANQYQGYLIVGTTTIELEEVTEAGVLTNITNADFANDSESMVNLTYRVA